MAPGEHELRDAAARLVHSVPISGLRVGGFRASGVGFKGLGAEGILV